MHVASVEDKLVLQTLAKMLENQYADTCTFVKKKSFNILSRKEVYTVLGFNHIIDVVCG